MKKTSLLAAAAALAFTGMSFAGGLSPAGKGNAVVKPAGNSSLATLYDQTDSGDGNGITSQNFESSFDVYDNMGADDFTVPKGTSWKITEVLVGGSYSVSGPVTNARVAFYKDSGGLPGALVKEYPAAPTTADNAGSLTLKLPTALKLKKGKYWVSVQANMDFQVGGQWYWSTRSVQSGNPAAWQNPGDGFATGCTTWGVESVCIASGQGPDKLFALMGKAK